SGGDGGDQHLRLGTKVQSVASPYTDGNYFSDPYLVLIHEIQHIRDFLTSANYTKLEQHLGTLPSCEPASFRNLPNQRQREAFATACEKRRRGIIATLGELGPSVLEIVFTARA